MTERTGETWTWKRHGTGFRRIGWVLWDAPTLVRVLVVGSHELVTLTAEERATLRRADVQLPSPVRAGPPAVRGVP